MSNHRPTVTVLDKLRISSIAQPPTAQELLRAVEPGRGRIAPIHGGGSSMAEFDVVIIRGGPVMDGNRSLAFRADVGVRGGRAAGFRDRGALLEGMPADVVVYDLARLKRLPDWWDSEVAHDFPGGEWRRVQRAEDYHWTLVNEQRKCTGATPGKLLRHGSAS